jgi:hypothetical protein
MTGTLVRALRLVVVGLLASLVCAGTANAGLGIACPDPISYPFKPWGDPAKYAVAPNGGFESGATSWTLSGGAKVVAGNESFYVRSKSDRYSLSLPSGSRATSAPMCVSLLSSKMRFFAQNTGSSSALLKVQVIYGGGVGGVLGLVSKTLGIADVGYIRSGSSWQPSEAVGMLGGVLPLLTSHVQFRFTPADSSGRWRIDDVYLDPFIMR